MHRDKLPANAHSTARFGKARLKLNPQSIATVEHILAGRFAHHETALLGKLAPDWCTSAELFGLEMLSAKRRFLFSS